MRRLDLDGTLRCMIVHEALRFGIRQWLENVFKVSHLFEVAGGLERSAEVKFAPVKLSNGE